MTTMFFGLALAWQATVMPAAEGTGDLRGEWTGERLELGGGKSLFDDLFKAAVVEITDQEFLFKRDEKHPFKVRYSLSQAKTPKQIDLTDPDGKVILGIYKLEGDILTVCLANYPDKKRPTEFKASPDSNDYGLIVLKRKIDK